MNYLKCVDELDRWASYGMDWMVDGLLTTLFQTRILFLIFRIDTKAHIAQVALKSCEILRGGTAYFAHYFDASRWPTPQPGIF